MLTREAPVQVGERLELEVTGISHAGVGIGRIKGFTVFVPYALIGEKVNCQIEEIKKGFAEAKLLEVIQKADNRCEPLCPDFYNCGGSHLQHLEYAAQLEVKHQIVSETLKRIGKIQDIQVNPVIGAKEPYGYRNKAVFQLGEKAGKIKLGFFEEDSHQVTASYDCLLLHRQIREIAGAVEGLLNKHAIPLYDWNTGQGVLRHVVIRRSRAFGKVMVVFVTSPANCPTLISIAKELGHNPVVASVIRNINDNPGRAIFGSQNKLLAGSGKIFDQLCGLKFGISPTSFYQVNPDQTEKLYSKVVEFAGLTGTETVLDVYCGIGTIGLYLSKFAKKVIGLEVHAAATTDAAENAKENQITNAEFIVGKAEERLPKLANQGTKVDVVVVDPPRKGVDKKALLAIAELQPERLVYVSCDPASLARDLDFMKYRGYKAVEVQPVDMFPQTHHVESIILMTYCGSKEKK